MKLPVDYETFKVNASGSRVLIAENIYLPALGRKRNIWIYLPPDYDSNLKYSYPVIYMNDGQNLFTDSGYGCWEIDKRMDEYFAINRKAAVVIGIENGKKHRQAEYLPWNEGEAYATDWRNVIQPLVTRQLRVRKNRKYTAFFGSSLGATILLEFLASHQDSIANFAFFSPAVEVDFDETLEMAEGIEFSHDCKLYFDIGETEATSQGDDSLDDDEYIFRANEIATVLRENCDQPALFVVDSKHTTHNECSWGARFLLAVNWLQNHKHFFEDDVYL